MKIVSRIGLAVLMVAMALPAGPTAHYRKHGPAILNDPIETPGVVRTIKVSEICGAGSTQQFRHTTEKMKDSVYIAYGAVKKAAYCCEVDHLISLELGGLDDVKNLWPQPYEPRPGAHEKDLVENWLHGQVCKGKISPVDAQRQIATDWYALYLDMPKSDAAKLPR